MAISNGPVWIIAERVKGKILAVSFQLIGLGRKLADKLNVNLEVLILGSGINQHASQLFAAGADVIFLGEDPSLEQYQSELYSETIFQAARIRMPDILLIGSTSMGRELAPLLAARLGTGITVHSTGLTLNDDRVLEQKVPAYGVMLTNTCPQKRPQMGLISQGVFPDPILNPQRKGVIIRLQPPQDMIPHIELLEIIPKEGADRALESASIVVAGGAGAVDLSGWRLINKLAETINAAVGSTRPAVDEGWADLDTMIGQSGKMTNPDLYIGVGISGELQHMVGIVGAKVKVAINNDPKAPIFQQVDYGVVDDCREFLPVLINQVEVYKRTKKRGD